MDPDADRHDDRDHHEKDPDEGDLREPDAKNSGKEDDQDEANYYFN